MVGLPPGNILQNLYLQERIKVLQKNGNKKFFIEVGSGNGYISNVLLNLGLSGIGIDLNEGACKNNRTLNKFFIENGKYEVIHGDFLENDWATIKTDIVLSSMVIEHLPNPLLNQYFQVAKSLLNNNGTLCTFVPSSMKHWGIEDEIAGHIKRYEYRDFEELSKKYKLKISNLAGLTFPMSNLLFSLSNFLVNKYESDKLKLSQQEQTVYTGNRNVPYKTSFPKIFNLILNPFILYPLHLLQKMFLKNANAMVIYAELNLD